MLRRVGLAALALIVAMPAASAEEPKMQHATGTFEVKITPEASAESPAGGVPTARMGLSKIFSGGLVGEAKGAMLSAGELKPGSAAAYVAIDQFQGALDGRKGGFVLLHRGTMTKTGGGELTIIIAPDSGTGELAGIEGALSIEIKQGKHFYDLSYTLPPRS